MKTKTLNQEMKRKGESEMYVCTFDKEVRLFFQLENGSIGRNCD